MMEVIREENREDTFLSQEEDDTNYIVFLGASETRDRLDMAIKDMRVPY